MNYDEYLVESDDYITQKTLKEKDKYGYGQIEIVQKRNYADQQIEKNDISDEEYDKIDLDEVDPEQYIRFPLSLNQKDFITEIQLFVHTDSHPAIVHFEGFIFLPKHLAITEYYPNGSLKKLLKDISEGKPHPEWDGTMKSKCVFGIACALTHLHNSFPGYTMKYLCPANIMFDSENEPKLINFVFGKSDHEKSNAYIPPELHQDSSSVHRDEDVWAFGMILYEILTGHAPYDGDSEEQIKDKILRGILPELPPPSPETDSLVGIIQNCLEMNRLNRPLFYMIFDHLSNLSNDLFPGTDSTKYNIYRDFVKQKTVQNDKSLAYIQRSSHNGNKELNIITEKAAKNDPFSINLLGRMIQKGTNGYAKNEKKGFDYFMRAAEKEFPVALYNASICLRDGRGTAINKEKAFILMEQAAHLGNKLAFNEYGVMIRDGIGTKADKEKAKEVFQEGSQSKNGLCQINLANLLLEEGGQENIVKALRLFELATINGCPEALFHHAFYYLNKPDHSQSDEIRGITLLKRAARKNNPEAQFELGRFYIFGTYHTKIDCKEGARLLNEAKNRGHILAMVEYAACCKEGKGVDKNLQLSRQLYEKAAKLNNKRALHNYAKMLYDGVGGEKEIQEAAKYFKLAADQGVVRSMYFYGRICILGEGGEKNMPQGKAYMGRYLKSTESRPDTRFPDAVEIYKMTE